MHKINAAGVCSKNGPHCMFSHGKDDLREPVYDVAQTETGAMAAMSSGGSASPVTQSYETLIEDEPLDPRWTGNWNLN